MTLHSYSDGTMKHTLSKMLTRKKLFLVIAVISLYTFTGFVLALAMGAVLGLKLPPESERVQRAPA